MEKYEKIIEMPSVSEEKKTQVDTSPKIKERNFSPAISTFLLTIIFCLIFYFTTKNPISDLYINSNNNSSLFQNSTKIKDKIKIHKRENDYYKSDEELLAEYKKAKIYFDTCMSGKLIDKNRTFEKSENPNISVVIPVYNSQNIIKPVIRSIQNQNFTNLEIVLVNDFSTDDSKIIIEQLQREDPRIRLLNNKKNMGTLYSRSVGTLAVKGSYIFPLDNDDLFYDETIFDIVYHLAVNGSFDIVEFKAVEHTNYIIDTSKKMKDSEYSNHKNNLVLYQPELGRFPRIRNNKYGVYDCFLWAKCIKSDVYKKTLNKIGEKSYSLRIIWGEDLVTSFALFRTASSFKFIGKYGIFRYKNKKTASNNTPYKLYALSIVLYMDVVYNFTSNSIEDKKYAVDVAIGYFKNIRMIRELNDPQRKYLNTILAKYLKSKFINEVDKNRIRNIFSKYNKLGIVVN